MKFDLLNSKKLKEIFMKKGYNCLKPYPIINNNDTVFVSAGIQPLLKDYSENIIKNSKKIYISQPVIRTQYSSSIDEGTSIAFVNVTTAQFNNTEEDHEKMIKEWHEILYEFGMNRKDISSVKDVYETTWGDLELRGKRVFHYYKGIEIGDTTFFTKITNNKNKINIESMSDLGFGLERLRWKLNNSPYYELYSDSNNINVSVKAYLSVIALLAVNDIKPSNKNSGYRARMFSKKLIGLLQGKNLNQDEEKYLDECIDYWKDWQENANFNDKQVIINEYIRNGNRYILDLLSNNDYNNLSGININVSRQEFIKRLITSGVDEEKIKKIVR